MSKDLIKKIRETASKSRTMRELAFDLPYEESQKLRQEQDEVFKKYQFLCGLNDALNKKDIDKKIEK